MARIAGEVAICLTLALACGSAGAGERMALQGSDATVVAPEGWTVFHMSSDPPFLRLTACDPAVAGGCQVLAEMDLERLQGGRAPASLDAVFSEAAAMQAKSPVLGHAVPLQRLKVAGHEAVETFSVGDVNYNFGGGDGATSKSAYRAITLQAGSTFYRCTVSTSQPVDAGRWRGALIEFCSSLNIAQAERPTGKQ